MASMVSKAKPADWLGGGSPLSGLEGMTPPASVVAAAPVSMVATTRAGAPASSSALSKSSTRNHATCCGDTVVWCAVSSVVSPP